MLSHFKDFFKRNEADIVLVVGIILISLISFGSGWIMANNNKLSETMIAKSKSDNEIEIEEGSNDSAIKSEDFSTSKGTKEETVKTEINEENNQEIQNDELEKKQEKSEEKSTKNISTPSSCKYVGSKNSDVYHLPDCPGAKRIKEENKRCFSSKSEAEKAGYRPAENCPGI